MCFVVFFEKNAKYRASCNRHNNYACCTIVELAHVLFHYYSVNCF